jgi:hypothetical protein
MLKTLPSNRLDVRLRHVNKLDKYFAAFPGEKKDIEEKKTGMLRTSGAVRTAL